jgi:hypothetical protein
VRVKGEKRGVGREEERGRGGIESKKRKNNTLPLLISTTDKLTSDRRYSSNG